MSIKVYINSLTTEERKALAEKVGTSVAYLSQLASGHRKAGVRMMVALEAASKGQLSRQDIRPDIFK